MNAQHWEIFADLVERIVDMEGTWQEKRATVERAVCQHSTTERWEEFISWFDEDSDKKYSGWQRKQFLPRERTEKGGKQ